MPGKRHALVRRSGTKDRRMQLTAHLRHVHSKRRTMTTNPVAIALAALAASTSSLSSAQVYKCPDASGRTVIQQAPCSGGQRLKVRPASGFDNPEQDAAVQQRKEGSNQAILAGIAQGKPAVGMSEANLRMAMGQPVRINEDNYNGRKRDQWIYERPEGTWYVYVYDGEVRSTQFRNYPNRASMKRDCPSAIEIRNLETSANSVTISEERRRALTEQVARAKACR